MLNRNNFWIGILIGLGSAFIAEGLIYGVNFILNITFGVPMLALKKMLFSASALNILPVRYFFVNLSLDKSGLGILVITVILVISVTLLMR